MRTLLLQMILHYTHELESFLHSVEDSEGQFKVAPSDVEDTVR